MRNFIVTTPGKGMNLFDDELFGKVNFKITDSYVEFERCSENGTCVVWYAIPHSENKFYIATCFTELDDIFKPLLDKKINIEDAFYKCKTMQVLLEMGERQEYDYCALIRDNDLDNNTPVWFLIGSVNESIPTDIDGMFDLHSWRVIHRILNKSQDLLEEISGDLQTWWGALIRSVSREFLKPGDAVINMFGVMAGLFSGGLLEKPVKNSLKIVQAGVTAHQNKIEKDYRKGIKKKRFPSTFQGETYHATMSSVFLIEELRNELIELQSNEYFPNLLAELKAMNIYLLENDGKEASVFWQIASCGLFNNRWFNEYTCEQYYAILEEVYKPIAFTYDKFKSEYFR